MFEFRARYDSPPAPGSSGPVTIELPGGDTIHPDDPIASEVLSGALGRKVRIEPSETAQAERAGIDPATVFGDVPVDQVLSGITAATMPDDFGLARGTFFDSAVIHVLASGTLRHMATLAAAGSVFDPCRFRPTIYVDTGDDARGFVEDGWLDGALAVGDRLRIVEMKPALRCVMTTHPQDGLARDLAIFRTAAYHHRANVGVFASVAEPGAVRLGDPVYLVT